MNTTHRLWIDVIKMILNKLHRCRQISGVEFIRDVPSKRSKLASFLNNGVQESCSIQHWFPLGHVGHIELILWENKTNLKNGYKLPALFFHENVNWPAVYPCQVIIQREIAFIKWFSSKRFPRLRNPMTSNWKRSWNSCHIECVYAKSLQPACKQSTAR